MQQRRVSRIYASSMEIHKLRAQDLCKHFFVHFAVKQLYPATVILRFGIFSRITVVVLPL